MIKNKFETFNMLPAIIHNGEFPNKQKHISSLSIFGKIKSKFFEIKSKFSEIKFIFGKNSKFISKISQYSTNFQF